MREAHASLDPGEIGDLVVDRALEWLKAAHCALIVADHDGHIVPLAGRGLIDGLSVAAQSVAQWVITHGREFTTADLARDARVTGAGGAVVGWPLRARGRTIGALGAEPLSRGDPKLGHAVAELLLSVLEGPAVALDNALRLRRAGRCRSPTTDAAHFRYLNLVLRRESKRASRNGRPLSLLFMDLDGFKAVNDTYGHLAGSRALVEAALVIRRSARETDVVARFGGDEFALVLPDTGSEGAAAVGERIRERIAEHAFLEDAGLNIHLTLSVGVATLPDVAASAEELVRAADTAMYQVKGSGKNGIFIARGEQAAE
jgi:diguanylate cyclase (GGDEF)-like protein